MSKESIFDCKTKLCLGRQGKYIMTLFKTHASPTQIWILEASDHLAKTDIIYIPDC